MLFSNKRESNLRSCVQMVEDTITSLGHSLETSRLPKEGLPAWRVQKGSAHVYIVLSSRDDKNYLRVTAPVLHVEGSVDRLALYQRLLELNETHVSGAAFALRGNTVMLTIERVTVDLDPSEVTDLVRRVEDYADHFDDVLHREFGGRAAGLSTSPIK